MYERIIKHQNGARSGFSPSDTLREALELSLKYIKTHRGISEIHIRAVNKPSYSDKDSRTMAGIVTYT